MLLLNVYRPVRFNNNYNALAYMRAAGEIGKSAKLDNVRINITGQRFISTGDSVSLPGCVQIQND